MRPKRIDEDFKRAEASNAWDLEIQRTEEEADIDQRDLEEMQDFWQRCDDADAEMEDAA